MGYLGFFRTMIFSRSLCIMWKLLVWSLIGHLGVIGEETARGGGGAAWGGRVYALEQVGARAGDLGIERWWRGSYVHVEDPDA